jgi:hypothetical protein
MAGNTQGPATRRGKSWRAPLLATAFFARRHRFREFYLHLFIIQEGRQEAIRSEINNH